MEEELSLKEMQKTWHGSLRSYLIGFIASLLLTTLAFLLVYGQVFSGPILIMTISGLALVQAAFQLKYFLNLGKEEKPYWETFIFFFMLLILLIIVCGSLWIMHDLNVRMMNMETIAYD
ncbi:MAG: Cytochrome bo(3) ubiquinol oxidase subunit 4 [Chlamydiae bacterium]|nr:Cytochrome bo(3) ubiquinol oxidase subunit 4 [Chlamydiota bacterium]